ncbi:hypothetical protein BGZ99_004117 [Dissophora globulifera]|uniref:Arrestin-like N-terminal domain-containing protein n=1 Tax=Dissophora globulifera TaxID=979702 RepID=A0A9P6RJJ3_9FUNG|nr:hypothetical protein BGZ99_004117 [Dissophora globulifera]
MRPSKDGSPAVAKQKTLSIHIATDHVGPNGMPLVYGSTSDRIGTIRGTVRFSTSHDCRGRDIVIMYEAKAEAQWTALENKKIVKHRTEEVFGHHFWHFPLEHTRPNGFKVVAGVYEKEFEVQLIHPSSSISGSMALLPSSSYTPHAKVKYTIRAILRRPFPSVNNLEASQEVWVLHSSLPPPASPRHPSRPPRSEIDHDQCGSQAGASASLSAAASTDDSTCAGSTPVESASLSKPSEKDEGSLSIPYVALTSTSSILKSALSMLPTFDIARAKHFLPLALPAAHTTDVTAQLSPEATYSKQPGLESAPALTVSSSTFEPRSFPKSTLSSPYSATTFSARPSSPSTDGGTSRSGSDSEYSGLSDDDEENAATYTGIWEPFHVPYSCSLPSERVFLGERVPLTIRFGPRQSSDHTPRRNGRRSNNRRSKKDMSRGRGRASGEKGGDLSDENHIRREDDDTLPQPGLRFVLKKGIVKVMEHTLLREVTVMPISSKHRPSASSHNSSTVRQELATKQALTNGGDGSLLTIPGVSTNQSLAPIYQERKYSGSHPHLYDVLQHEIKTSIDTASTPRQRQQHTDSTETKRRSFFQLKRRSLDIPAKSTPAPLATTHDPAAIMLLPPSSPHLKPSNNNSTRIINTVESKFKTEIMTLSLTSQLQRRERQLQRYIDGLVHRSPLSNHRVEATTAMGRGERREQQHHNIDPNLTRHVGIDLSLDDSDDDGSEHHHHYNWRDSEDAEKGVWQTTVWIQLPGPAEMGTFTETKHILKRHTLQLILLCGLVDGTDSEPSVVAESKTGGGASALVSVINQPGINKEFRLEMDLNVTGPRAPM